METTIYLVRHTQTVGNIEKRLTGRQDYELTDEGMKYVQKLTNKLKNIRFDVIYSSTSKRTSKTVQKIAILNDLPIIELDDLCEMYFGIYDGMKWEEVNKINPEIHKLHEQTNEIMNIPEQESTTEVAERMYKTISKIAKNNSEKNILICSHGVAIEAFLRKISGIPFIEKKQEYSQKNTSLNIITFNDKELFKIQKMNDIEHLISE